MKGYSKLSLPCIQSLVLSSLVLLLGTLRMAKPSLDEERAIYLVLMDGEPVAFRQGATPPRQHNRFQPAEW